MNKHELGQAFEGRKKLVFWFFAFFAKFRPASRDPGLGFGAPFWAPGGVFTARGLEKHKKKPKNKHDVPKDKIAHTPKLVLRGGFPSSWTAIFLFAETPWWVPIFIGAVVAVMVNRILRPRTRGFQIEDEI